MTKSTFWINKKGSPISGTAEGSTGKAALSILCLLSVGAEHMAITVQPDESEDNAGNCPAQWEAQIDGGQCAMHWENEQQPQQAHATDSDKHDDGG